VVEVLVEGPSDGDPGRAFGRTPENRMVHFEGEAPAGALVRVRVGRAGGSSLGGELVD
jgi:tRNA-2-methylthio-N6-dimethylallyladenosine synthase